MAITDFRGKKDTRSKDLYSEDTLNYRLNESRKYAVKRDFNSAINVLSSTVRDLENAHQLGYLDDDSAGRVARYAWKNAHMISGLAEDEPEVDNQALSLIATLEEDFKIKKWPIFQKPALAASIISLFGGLFLFLPNITGHVIGGTNLNFTNMVGIGLIVLSLILGFYWINSKK